MVTLEPPRKMVGPAQDDSAGWRALGLSRTGLERFVRTAQTAVGLRGEVDVLLADDRTLRKLNREWRGKDEATDVLSFPAPTELAEISSGDLAVSLETATRQASEHGHLLRDEVRILLLHGLLHLSGMDHENDRGEMAAREAKLRKELRLKVGLIARVEQGTSGKKKVATVTKKARKLSRVRRAVTA
jgi:probable rRNA maturation factor